jgi:hypothetical protein
VRSPRILEATRAFSGIDGLDAELVNAGIITVFDLFNFPGDFIYTSSTDWTNQAAGAIWTFTSGEKGFYRLRCGAQARTAQTAIVGIEVLVLNESVKTMARIGQWNFKNIGDASPVFQFDAFFPTTWSFRMTTTDTVALNETIRAWATVQQLLRPISLA